MAVALRTAYFFTRKIDGALRAPSTICHWSLVICHWRRWLTTAGATFLVLTVATGAAAYSFYSCGPGCAPRWPGGRIVLHANQEVSDCDLAALNRAIARWNAALAQAGGKVEIVLAGRTPDYGLRQNGVSTVSLLVRNWPKERRLFGWTSIWWRNGRITEGDIVFNLQDHRFRCDIPRRRAGVASLEQEMMHELGHLLGLQHAPTGIMMPEGYGAAVDADALGGLRVLYGRSPASTGHRAMTEAAPSNVSRP